LEYKPLTFVPSVATVPAMAMEMPEATKAYSIAVAPLVSPAKRRSDLEIAVIADLNMASPFVAFL
jgi:hypothetical protein